jgi:hypothetical protein
VIQFLSYEGAFEAKNGAASGIFSNNISISQNGSPQGQSLQLTQQGNRYQDFEWVIESETAGRGNLGQSFISVQFPPAVQVSEPNFKWLFILSIIALCLGKKSTKRRFKSIY